MNPLTDKLSYEKLLQTVTEQIQFVEEELSLQINHSIDDQFSIYYHDLEQLNLYIYSIQKQTD